MHPKRAQVVSRSGRESRKRASLRCYSSAKTPLPEPPIAAGCFLPSSDQSSSFILARVCANGCLGWCPDNGQATGLRGEHINLNYFPPSSPRLCLYIEALFKMTEVGTKSGRKQAQPKDHKRRSGGNTEEERRENGLGGGLAGSRRAQASFRPRPPLLIRRNVFPIGSFRCRSGGWVPLSSSPLRFQGQPQPLF